MTCPLPNAALQKHDRQLNFSAIRPQDSQFDSLPPGGANQTYTVSVSNNGRDFGASQTYTLYNSTCFSCTGSGLMQRVSRFTLSLIFRAAIFVVVWWAGCSVSDELKKLVKYCSQHTYLYLLPIHTLLCG